MKPVRRLRRLALLLAVPFLAPGLAAADAVTMASTTSTRDSGLLDAILPGFTAETGIAVRVVAVGTGRAIDLARRGDADVLFVHDRASEEALLGSWISKLHSSCPASTSCSFSRFSSHFRPSQPTPGRLRRAPWLASPRLACYGTGPRCPWRHRPASGPQPRRRLC